MTVVIGSEAGNTIIEVDADGCELFLEGFGQLIEAEPGTEGLVPMTRLADGVPIAGAQLILRRRAEQ